MECFNCNFIIWFNQAVPPKNPVCHQYGVFKTMATTLCSYSI